jgi:HpiC1 cyclase/PEP-CTERM motif
MKRISRATTFLLVGAFMIFGHTVAHATLIPIINAGFEDPDVDVAAGALTCGGTGGCYTTGSFTGWTVTGSGGVFDPSKYAPAGYSAPEGDQVAYSSGGMLSQVLSVGLEANMVYTLDVLVGDRADTGFPGYEVQLLAGGNLLASVNETMFSPANGSFIDAHLEYASGSDFLGQLLEIRLISDGSQINWDNIRLDPRSVPEPAALMLLSIGLLALGFLRRRRRLPAA